MSAPFTVVPLARYGGRYAARPHESLQEYEARLAVAEPDDVERGE